MVLISNTSLPGDTERDRHELLFLGSLDWRPNVDGVRQFLDNVFPRILAEEPDAKLTIVGRNPPESLVDRIQAERSVSLQANVPDVRPFLRRAGMLVVPLRIGGGSRLKILEALATETPVVSTKVGAEGLSLLPDEHYWESEMESMADVAVRGIRNWETLRATSQQGRESVIRQYDWSVLAERLDSVWHQTAARETCTPT